MDMRQNTFQSDARYYLEIGNTGWNGQSGSGSDSKFRAQLVNLAYSEWWLVQRNSLTYLVDETGVEPATSSLRTMRI